MRSVVPPSLTFEDEAPPGSDGTRLAAPTRVSRWTGWRQAARAWRTRWGLLGTAIGVIAAGVPVAIGLVSAFWFALSDALDPPFLWFVAVAAFCWLAGVVFVVAAVLVCFQSTRALGVGYMVGTAIATVLGVLGFAMLCLVAVVADATVR
jgi:hypothetical protein